MGFVFYVYIKRVMCKAVRIAWEDGYGESLFKVFKENSIYTGTIISAKDEKAAIKIFEKFGK